MFNVLGYQSFLIILFLLSGAMILIFDVKAYSKLKMKKEKKAARFIGWLNIAIGTAILSANWIYERWFL